MATLAAASSTADVSFLVPVAVLAGVTTALTVRAQFFGYQLLGSWKARLYLLELVVLSALIPVVVAAFRPVLGLALGVAAPIPLARRPKEVQEPAKAFTAKANNALRVLVLALENELAEVRHRFCEPVVATLSQDSAAVAALSAELDRRLASPWLPDTQGIRAGRLKRAREVLDEVGDVTDLVLLAYEWRLYAVLRRF